MKVSTKNKKNISTLPKGAPALDRLQFSLFTTSVFFLVCMVGFYFHELWRDELFVFSKVVHEKRWLHIFDFDYSFIPYTFLMNLVFVVLGKTYFAFKLYHLLIITSTVFLLSYYAPFKRLHIVMIVFGYFFLYEYGIISKHYSFTLLLVTIIVILLTANKKYWLWISVFLLLLANNSINAVALAGGFTLYFIFLIYNRIKQQKLENADRLWLSLSAVVFVAGSILLVLQYYQVYIHPIMDKPDARPPVFMTIRCIWNSLINIPDLSSGINFRETNIIPYPYFYFKDFDTSAVFTSANFFAFFASLFILLVTIAKFSEKLPLMIVFVLTMVANLVFLQYYGVHYIRYQGYIYVTLIYCWWLFYYADSTIEMKLFAPWDRFFNKPLFAGLKKLFMPLMIIILISQLAGSLYAVITDLKYEYTLSHKAADYIRHNNFNDYILVGARDYSAQTVGIHLERPVFYPQSNTSGITWDTWNPQRRNDITVEEIFNSSMEQMDKNQKNVLLILSFPLTDANNRLVPEQQIRENILLRLVNVFEGDVIQGDEQYWLYTLTKTP